MLFRSGIAYTQTVDGKAEWIRLTISLASEECDHLLLENIGIKTNSSNVIIPLKKLVTINRVESQPQSYFRINGLNSIYMSICADENSNQLELSKQIKEELSKIQQNLPTGYEIHLSYDATEYIKAELSKIYFRSGLTLAFLLIFVLLTYRSLRHTFLIVFTLFCNLCIAVIFYYLLKLEIQLYSLAGITISLTLIIDNTIVMSDQIIRRKNMLSFTAILAATVTTVASLSIIFFLDEKLRLNLQDFAFVIILNLIISLFIALFLVPSLLEKLGITNRRRKLRRTSSNKIWDTIKYR